MAVTGGIGSGKSVVCRVLAAMGHEVYDCDSRAKWLMDRSEGIKLALAGNIHANVIKEGCIDRAFLSSIVFSDPEKLKALNSIVHGAVREDIESWIALHSDKKALFIETAILYQSGLDKMVHEVWEVVASERARIARVMARNGLDEAQVRARISSQEYIPENPHACVKKIHNDGDQSVLLQINALLNEI